MIYLFDATVSCKQFPRECRDCQTRLPSKTKTCNECSSKNIHTPPIKSTFAETFKGNQCRDPNKYDYCSNIIDAQPRKPLLTMFPQGSMPINPNTVEAVSEVLNFLFPDLNDPTKTYRNLNIVCSDALINGIIQAGA